MRTRERLRRLAWANGSMLVGTIVVTGTVVLINHLSDSLDESRAATRSQIALERKKPPAEQQVQKPKPKPKPKSNSSSKPAAKTSGLKHDPGCRRAGITPRRHPENFQVNNIYDKL